MLRHASLVLRVACGDARDWGLARDVGGALNVVAVLSLLVVLVWSATTAPRRSPRSKRQVAEAVAVSPTDVLLDVRTHEVAR